jgi:hypothetical protein
MFTYAKTVYHRLLRGGRFELGVEFRNLAGRQGEGDYLRVVDDGLTGSR